MSRAAPWIIGEPQPAVVDLERNGWIKDAVLDAGCGMGEHTIHLAELGYDVLGIDFSPPAVEQVLFHVFGPAERDAYTTSLRAVCRTGAYVHVLALSDAEPGFGPQINDSVIRDAFRDG